MRRSMKRVNVKKENKPFKTLAIATIAGLSIIGIGQAQAATLDDIDLSQKQINTPTLDYLHDNTVFLPQKTFQRDADGNIVKDADDKPIIQEGTPILAPQSGYSLTELEAKEDGSKPDGNNVITKFEVKDVTRYYDKTTGAIVPVYYRVDLKQTTYGDGNQSKTYTVNGINGGTYDITAKYNDSASKTYTTEYKDHKYEDTVTSTSYGTEIHSALKNSSGSTRTIKDAIFENNSTAIKNNSYYILNVYGGALYNAGEITGITADFINNSVTATGSSTYGYGGAIYNGGTIGDITGHFIGNSAGYYGGGGAIDNGYNSTIGDITGDFIGNSAVDNGGAIYSYSDLSLVADNRTNT